MVGIRFGGSRDEILTLMQRLGVITPPYFGQTNSNSRPKLAQFGNFKFLTLQDPQNPKLAPQGPDGARKAKKGFNHPSPVQK